MSSFFSKMFIVFSLLCFIINGVLMSKKAHQEKRCKFSKKSSANWTAVDFKSIITWKRAKCAHSVQNYTIEVCLPEIDHCGKNRGWVAYQCISNKTIGEIFSCTADIPDEYGAETARLRVCIKQNEKEGSLKAKKECEKTFLIHSIKRLSTFTGPNIDKGDVGKTDFTVSVKVPSARYMCNMGSFTYNLKVIKISGKQSSCADVNKTAPPERVTSIPVNSTSSDCSDPEHAQRTWEVDKLSPATKYCVFGTYKTKPSNNLSGSSAIGWISEPIQTESDPFWKSPYFITGGVVGVFFIFIVTSISILFQHKVSNPAKDIPESTIQVFSIVKEYKPLESHLQAEEVHRFDENEKEWIKRIQHKKTIVDVTEVPQDQGDVNPEPDPRVHQQQEDYMVWNGDGNSSTSGSAITGSSASTSKSHYYPFTKRECDVTHRTCYQCKDLDFGSSLDDSTPLLKSGPDSNWSHTNLDPVIYIENTGFEGDDAIVSPSIQIPSFGAGESSSTVLSSSGYSPK